MFPSRVWWSSGPSRFVPRHFSCLQGRDISSPNSRLYTCNEFCTVLLPTPLSAINCEARNFLLEGNRWQIGTELIQPENYVCYLEMRCPYLETEKCLGTKREGPELHQTRLGTWCPVLQPLKIRITYADFGGLLRVGPETLLRAGTTILGDSL